MANVLNAIIANQPMKPAKKQEQNAAYTFTSEGKIKPMKDKGRLLPSKLFNSPVEMARDLKGDIVSIGKAAKGKANDHELGRINDLAMKMGGLGLAAYLCTKNPQKLGKAMEFVGLGTFFGAMALWPKLAIQAPIKARTGVDIHQKYVDSQGRKKMLFQDPQYVLTDLYSREDLDKMGKKLGVSENLPDRDNFIKRRAEKTALQGNTLWMMTAGLATPLLSALACNRLEQPVNTLIEEAAIVSSESGLKAALGGTEAKGIKGIAQKAKNFVSGIAQKIDDRKFEKLLNSGNASAKDIAARIGSKLGDVTLTDALEKQISTWAKAPEFTVDTLRNTSGLGSIVDCLDSKAKGIVETLLKQGDFDQVATTLNNSRFKNLKATLPEKLVTLVPQGADLQTIKTALKGQVDDVIINALDGLNESQIKSLASGKLDDISAVLTSSVLNNHVIKNGRKELVTTIRKAKAANNAAGTFSVTPEIAEKAKALRSSVSGFVTKQGKLDKFISARVGQQGSSHVANQWGKVWGTFLSSLKLTDDELKILAGISEKAKDGEKIDQIASKLTSKIDDLVADDKRFDKTVSKLMKLIGNYEERTGAKTFVERVANASQTITAGAQEAMTNGLGDDAAGVLRQISTNAVDRAVSGGKGARSSFYRLVKTLDIFKRAKNGDLAKQLKEQLAKNAPELTGQALDDSVAKLVNVGKKVILSAGTTDYTEKLMTQGYNISVAEYKSMLSVLFGDTSTITSALEQTMSKERASKLVGGLKSYQDDFMSTVVNWANNMTSDTAQRLAGAATNSPDGKKRAATVGQEITNAIKKTANNKYNSNKWLKIFGISFAALTAVTLVAGLLIGRKGETEKQVEAESKVNG